MANDNQIAGRWFLVGCERSGTTLLQAMLARHSRVLSFPESHFFCRAAPTHRVYRSLGLANWRRARLALYQLLKALARKDLAYNVPGYSPWLSSYVRAFCCILDRAALDHDKDIWLEKTPHHLYQIPVIRRLIPGARFIHILRDGRDVAASIYDAGQQDPDYWGKWEPERLAQWWNRAVQASLAYQDDPAHILVSYEALLDEPQGELLRVCDFLGVGYEAEMLRHWEAAPTVAGWMGTRSWMRQPFEPLQDTRLKKFVQVFSEQEQQYIREHMLWGGEVRPVLEKANHRAGLATIHAGQR